MVCTSSLVNRCIKIGQQRHLCCSWCLVRRWALSLTWRRATTCKSAWRQKHNIKASKPYILLCLLVYIDIILHDFYANHCFLYFALFTFILFLCWAFTYILRMASRRDFHVTNKRTCCLVCIVLCKESTEHPRYQGKHTVHAAMSTWSSVLSSAHAYDMLHHRVC